MNSSEFRKLLAEYFSPKIRDLGWKDSGFHFRKAPVNHIGNLFGIQGSWYGGTVCCEVAIFFDFLNDLEFEKSTYATSLIRERISPKGISDYHWRLGKSKDENIAIIDSIWNAFNVFGTSFYNDFSSFPHPFDKIEPGEIEENNNFRILGKYFVTNKIEFVYLLKEINNLLGNNGKAQEFSQIGLRYINELANDLLVGRKTKSYRENEKFIENQIQRLKLN